MTAKPGPSSSADPIVISDTPEPESQDGNPWYWVGGGTLAVAAGIALYFVLRPEQVDPVKAENGTVTF